MIRADPPVLHLPALIRRILIRTPGVANLKGAGVHEEDRRGRILSLVANKGREVNPFYCIRDIQPGEAEQGRHHVDSTDGKFEDCTGFYYTGIAEEKWNLNALIPGPLLLVDPVRPMHIPMIR